MTDTLAASDHPLRYTLTNELHARPFADLKAPEQASHFAMLSAEGDAARERGHLHALCGRYNLPHPPGDATHFALDFGAFRLKWERHTEFATYTFFRHGKFGDPFADTAAAAVPADWLSGLPGARVVAAHVVLAARDAPEASAADLERHFVTDSLSRGSMMEGLATVSTDFRIHADGFTRTLVHDHGMAARQAGRLVQRLLEIETYRNMALLALPLAREESPAIRRIGESLADLTTRMDALESIEDERALLGRLTGVSAEIEQSIAATSYRFGAAGAYNALVEERIAEVRERRLGHYSTLNSFVERRLAPAMRTCESVAARQRSLSERATRAANLLRTRVDIKVEGQNRDLLASMNRRAHLQLRLQRTVEGLSVAAIAYYIVSLIGYGLDAFAAWGIALNVKAVQGGSVPVVALVVWLGARGVRKRLERDVEG